MKEKISTLATIGGFWPVMPLLPPAEPQLSPDPIDAFATVMTSLTFQFGVQPRRAVSATTLPMDQTDLFGQKPIFQATHTRALWLHEHPSGSSQIFAGNHQIRRK